MRTPKPNQTEIFKEYLLLRGLSEKTRGSILKAVNYFAKWLEEENIKPELVSYNDIVAYLNHCKKKGNKQRTLQVSLNCLKHYYNFLINQKEISENPCTNIDIKGVKRKMLYETFSLEELEGIYRTYANEKNGKNEKTGLGGKLTQKRNKVILGLIIYQAVRTEELANLTVSDIKLKEGKIILQGTSRHNQRELKLEAHQLYELMDYINETRKLLLALRDKESSKLFLSIGTSEKFNNIMQQLTAQLTKQDKGIKHVKQLRASVISNWLKVHNIRRVQYMAGHRYVSSTEGYQASNMEDLKEEISRYHPDL